MAVSPPAEAYLRDIADEMVQRFGIPSAEAVARINHAWSGLVFDDDNDLIFHELPEFWAHALCCERAPACRGAAAPGEHCTLRAAPPPHDPA
ncbi:hypothetical protein [Streptomyces sp. NPDC052496]|uniref:hypothetical protein n=1 Tax=Streptomyces sp. NPDC052496 TaxID=3154951 RepID=UPI003447E535